MRFNFRYPPKEAPQELKGYFLSDFVCAKSKRDEIDRIDGNEAWRMERRKRTLEKIDPKRVERVESENLFQA